MMQAMTAAERLERELKGVTGATCGWQCAEHHDQGFVCQRAVDHAGAAVMTDLHLWRDPGGNLVTAHHCCG